MTDHKGLKGETDVPRIIIDPELVKLYLRLKRIQEKPTLESCTPIVDDPDENIANDEEGVVDDTQQADDQLMKAGEN